ncbi:MAG: LysR family transcriptional regulator [Hyphomicrobiales bacterium]
MPRYTLRQLEYFVTAAEAGSVAGAASKLNVSQPSISTAIAKLEDMLGVQVFMRHHAAGISLTPAGARLIAEARNLLRHSEEFERQAQRAGGEIAGTLKLASFTTLGPAILPGIISGFADLYPDVMLDVSEATQDDLIEGLRQSRFEQAIIYAVDLPDDIDAVSLAEIAPYVLLPQDHHLAKNETIELNALVEEDFILLDVPPSRDFFLGLFETAGLTPKVAFTSPSIELVRGLVGRGLGYSLLVTRPHGDMTYDGQKLVGRPIAGNPEPGRIALARSQHLRKTRLMVAFEEFCVAFFQTAQP